ncbi:MAG: hypothetical protein H0Z28_09575 [Archaeoglobus sp.]|nr:hypothetical protein [Archaeoglobus sp.]
MYGKKIGIERSRILRRGGRVNETIYISLLTSETYKIDMNNATKYRNKPAVFSTVVVISAKIKRRNIPAKTEVVFPSLIQNLQIRLW